MPSKSSSMKRKRDSSKSLSMKRKRDSSSSMKQKRDSSSSMKQKRKVSPSVLLITTHGGYPSMGLYRSPINVNKINAVTMGICNYLGSYSAHSMGEIISRVIKQGRVTDMENGSEIIRGILMNTDTAIGRVKGNDDRKMAYNRVSDRAYQTHHIYEGSRFYDRTYTVYPDERVESQTPYFDTITLLTDDTHNDLVQEMLGRTYRKYEQEVKLSEILEHLKKKGIKDLIIADLSCSVTKLTSRSNRRIARGDIGYKQKKRKKPKSKGLKKQKTKKPRKSLRK
jgi:hypothetical protein